MVVNTERIPPPPDLSQDLRRVSHMEGGGPEAPSPPPYYFLSMVVNTECIPPPTNLSHDVPHVSHMEGANGFPSPISGTLVTPPPPRITFVVLNTERIPSPTNLSPCLRRVSHMEGGGPETQGTLGTSPPRDISRSGYPAD